MGLLRNVFRLTAPQAGTVREASSHWPPKKPRPYRRRLYEAALAPMKADIPKTCPSYRQFLQQFHEATEAYEEIELAFAKHVRQKLIDEGYQVMAICQRLGVKKRTEWLTQNKLRLAGLELYCFGNRTMRKVFEGTPLQTLERVLVSTNCQIYGKDIEAIRTIVTECKNIHWIIPLVVVYGSRILSMDEVEKLCRLPSLEDHRAQTVQLLLQTPTDLISSVAFHMSNLVGTLYQIEMKDKEGRHEIEKENC